jgi:bacterioferritin-associated ferredoxin
VIVCSCNVLSDKQILATLQLGAGPPAAGQVYRCLGCAPRCGRCLETVRALLVKAQLESCQVGCTDCPAQEGHDRTADGHAPAETPVFVPAE